MRIKLTSVLVDDQDKALHFYTDVLGSKGPRSRSAGTPGSRSSRPTTRRDRARARAR
jgi:catechol 2,3-dioxygenase-like lactoylglutathione lyase family enzyme